MQSIRMYHKNIRMDATVMVLLAARWFVFFIKGIILVIEGLLYSQLFFGTSPFLCFFHNIRNIISISVVRELPSIDISGIEKNGNLKYCA